MPPRCPSNPDVINFKVVPDRQCQDDSLDPKYLLGRLYGIRSDIVVELAACTLLDMNAV